MCQKTCQVEIEDSQDEKNVAKKSKKDKGKKDKKDKDKKDKKDKKEKKAKKEKKRKEAAQTEEDEDSDMVEAKRQKIAAVTPQSAAPSTPATGGEDSGESPGCSSKASEVGKTDDTSEKRHAAPAPAEAVKPDDEKKKQEKAAKNNAALTQLALHRASTEHLAVRLQPKGLMQETPWQARTWTSQTNRKLFVTRTSTALRGQSKVPASIKFKCRHLWTYKKF